MKILILILFLATSLNAQPNSLIILLSDDEVTQAECTSAGIAYIALTNAYGVWEFDLYKDLDASASSVEFIGSDTDPTNAGGYGVLFTNTEATQFNRTGIAILNKTAGSYVSIATWYRLKIVRAGDGEFTNYIKGGSFGNSYLIIDVSGGSGTNPVTDNAHTTSAFFTIDLDAGDILRDVVAPSGKLNLLNMTVDSGAYTLSKVKK